MHRRRYKLDPSDRPQLLKAAVRCAATLVAKINLGANESISPWPFRVYAATGEVVQHYSSHVLGNIVFLDSLLSIPGAVNASTARAIQSARDFAWKWQARFPLLNSRWCGFCEDIRDPDENDANGNCDYDSIQWGLLARYLMDNADTHPEWENTVPELLQYVESHLIFWDKPGPHSPPVQWGARCVSEQKVDPNRMSCHTSRYASVLSQYAALHAARNASAAAALHKAAERSWAWASYCMQHSGNILVTPHQGESDAWFAVTIDVVLNTLHMMLSGTQHAHISTPVRRSHILLGIPASSCESGRSRLTIAICYNTGKPAAAGCGGAPARGAVQASCLQAAEARLRHAVGGASVHSDIRRRSSIARIGFGSQHLILYRKLYINVVYKLASYR